MNSEKEVQAIQQSLSPIKNTEKSTNSIDNRSCTKPAAKVRIMNITHST